MVTTPRTVQVEPGSELGEALAKFDERPVMLEHDGVRYRLNRVEGDAEDVFSTYDPERFRRVLAETAGVLRDVDAEQWIQNIYRWREDGTRPPDRPRQFRMRERD